MPKTKSYDPSMHPYCEFFDAFHNGEPWALDMAENAAQDCSPPVTPVAEFKPQNYKSTEIEILPPSPKPLPKREPIAEIKKTAAAPTKPQLTKPTPAPAGKKT